MPIEPGAAMALIKCSECGRTVSDQAAACVGCGAPIRRPSKFHGFRGFNLAPTPSTKPPPSRTHLTWRAILSMLAFVAGVVWSSAIERRASSGRAATTLAALLVIVGLCGVIVTAVQFPWTRK
jgi:hypothetical protein